MRTTSLLASATVIGVASKGVRAFQYPVSRSLTQLVGAGSYASAVPTLNKNSGPIHLKRDGVRRYLWNSIFNAAGKGDGIDYSTLTGMEAKEAAELALKGVVQDKSKDGYEIATFAGGCFWGLELAYQRVVGVIDTSVGYTQGKDEKPTYDYVCSGMSGHTEAVQVFFDPKEVSYEYLCKLLLTRINPTLKNQVGNDRGTQYRHGIYYHNEGQEKVAKKVLEEAQAQFSKPIVTECLPATVYWPAEEYHQKYLEKGGRFSAGQSAAKGCTDPIRCYG
ncbi:hypothetical protein NSK_006086 [Nannochloropsis salina CCMP1776]|uniref:peptide-methionine (S)-S-oxide reductase n=1 Tax=Nannochloropsis salina CCMP1776 TaxID=1027361 RepID=A0A4D9CTX0_9STRA|nr:hypothetical protein NSK_006086 [Nannochloropsis salina CCMP1776]|eukprot:TFJ82662.1 hypothetical protein NSK_006086 [Nannochloropsis salina CCMP1776]